MHTATKRHLDRRAFLRGSGALLSLPFLEAMVPAFATRAQAAVANPPPRFLAMCATLGFHTPFLFPQETGADYTLTPYLEPLKEIVATGKTVADDLLERYATQWKGDIDPIFEEFAF